LYDVFLQQRGVVPNMFKTVAHAPALALGFAALLKPLLSDGALPGWYKELVATRMSVLQGSNYAVTAHSLSAKQKGATEEQIGAVKADFERGPFSDAEKLGLRCGDRLHYSASHIDDDFYANLKSAYSDAQIVELIATASVFEFFPRFVDALRIPVTPKPKNNSAGQV
jgi:AhpD family alkylhydroperoxidase